MEHILRNIFLAAALYACSVSLALGASVTIIPSGAGSFVIQGDNLNDVSGIDLTINYDTSVLSAPAVRWGSLVSGASSIANTTISGKIRIAIVSINPISGSGQIATLVFSSQNSGCGITSLFPPPKIIDSKSANVATQAGIVPAAICAKADEGTKTTDGTPVTDSGSSSQGSDNSGSSGSSTSVTTTSGQVTSETSSKMNAPLAGVPGTIIVPGEGQSQGETQPAEPQPTEPKVSPDQEASEVVQPEMPQEKPQEPEKKAETAEPAVAAQIMHSGVLDRFRGYQGEKTPAAFVALFTKVISPSIHQEPGIAISDGKAQVRLSVDLSSHKNASPNFAFTNAKLVSLRKGTDPGQWVLDTLPQLNALKAGVTILNGASVVEYPLTIVPPSAQVSGKQADFEAFLKDSGAKKPKHDLNGDGYHDYLDDYIYTAHYLITLEAKAQKAR